jgi:hypothetical protein
MATYICPRCHHSTNHKWNFIKHLNKAKTCDSNYSNIPIEDIMNLLDSPEIKKIKEHTKNKFVCDVCDKDFTKASNLSRHKKTHINMENANANTVATDSNNCNNTSNSHNTTTTNSHNINIENLTINLRPFGQERIDHVEEDPEFLLKCLQNISNDGLPDLIKAIFFNNDVPENKNLKLGKTLSMGKTLQVCILKDGDLKWEHKDADQILDTIIDKGCRILIRHNNTLYSIDNIDPDEEMTRSERILQAEELDRLDERNNKLTRICRKERGYGSFRRKVYYVALNNSLNN